MTHLITATEDVIANMAASVKAMYVFASGRPGRTLGYRVIRWCPEHPFLIPLARVTVEG